MPDANRRPTGALGRRVKWIAGGIVMLLVAAVGVVFVARAIDANTQVVETPDGGLSYAQLRASLQARGASVQEGGSGSGGFLLGTVHFLTVNGAKLNVYDYVTSQDASQDTTNISSDGSTIARTDSSGDGAGVAIDYIAPPHWFSSGHVIVLYVGCDTSVMSLLAEVVGLPFAGTGTVANPCPEPPLLTPTP